MAGAVLHWAWCEQARVRGVLEGWRSWRGKASPCGLADSLRRAPVSNREPQTGLSRRPGGYLGATRRADESPRLDTGGTGCDDQYGVWHQLEEGPHPGPHFPQTLKALRQVEVINFGDCLVRSKGAVAIADAVHGGLPKLKVLAGWLPPPSGVQAPPRSG